MNQRPVSWFGSKTEKEWRRGGMGLCTSTLADSLLLLFLSLFFLAIILLYFYSFPFFVVYFHRFLSNIFSSWFVECKKLRGVETAKSMQKKVLSQFLLSLFSLYIFSLFQNRFVMWYELFIEEFSVNQIKRTIIFCFSVNRNGEESKYDFRN